MVRDTKRKFLDLRVKPPSADCMSSAVGYKRKVPWEVCAMGSVFALFCAHPAIPPLPASHEDMPTIIGHEVIEEAKGRNRHSWCQGCSCH